MICFSTETQQALKTSGWREDRHVDTSDYERALLAAGFTDCQAPCQFLQRFGDLTLQLDPPSDEAYLNTLLSEIEQTMQFVPVSLFSQEVGRTLYFIGSCFYDFHGLLMDSSGRVYSHLGYVKADVFGTSLFLIAASGEEAIELLVRQHETGIDIQGEWIANGQWAALADGTIRVVSRVNPDYS